MDLDGNFYDTDVDGVYDLHDGNVAPDIYFGRLTASPMTYGGADEVSLVLNYFAKNHTYRAGGLITNNRALIFIDEEFEYIGSYIKENMENVYCQANLINGPFETTADSYETSLGADYEYIHLLCHSAELYHAFSGPYGEDEGFISYQNITTIDPTAIFYTLSTCLTGRFVRLDYLAGWYIFADSYGLASIGSAKVTSILDYYTFYNFMGDGATIGEAFKNEYSYFSMGGYDDFEVALLYGMTLFGDPTLKPRDRQPVVLPEADLPSCLKFRNYAFFLDADGGGAPPYDWQIIGGQLPTGLTLSQETGLIAGKPTESGTFDFTISANDLCQPAYGDTIDYNIGIIGVCGDANNSGYINMDDVRDIIDYLFNDGQNMCPVAAGDMDNFIGTNINDAYYLYEYVVSHSVFPRCPPFTESIPAAPENILEIRNSTVQPNRDKYRVDFYLNSLSPAMSISIPFEYSCATSSITCDSIKFTASSYSHYSHKYGAVAEEEPKAIIGIANTGENPPSANPARIASAWFSIDPSSEEQLIIINPSSYGPNKFILASPSPTAPYTPGISVIPGISFECGDANDDGAVNILDAVFLINYKYKDGPAPALPESSNINGDASINILDIVYLINLLYKDGPEPECS